MISQECYELGSKSSIIREIFSFGLKRKAEVGEDKVYDKAEPGAATLQFFRAGTTNVVLLLDEVDKMGHLHRDGDCYNALLSLLQGYDLYLEGRIDISSTLVIATANSIEGIPEAVINRFEVIHIPDYDFNTR